MTTMKFINFAFALMLLTIGNAQVCNSEFPYNPDANSDGIIGVDDLLSFLLVFGTEYPSENLFLSSDSCSAIFNAGNWNYGMCRAQCSSLPSGKWQVMNFSTWAKFHDEVETMTSDGLALAWLGDDNLPVTHSQDEFQTWAITGSTTYKGTITMTDAQNASVCICYLQENPKIEYSFCEGTSFASLTECIEEKLSEGWLPLTNFPISRDRQGYAGYTPSTFSSHYSAQSHASFWRWAQNE